MTIERFVVGPLGTNCYILGNEKKALVIDPGGHIDLIKQSLRSRELEYILITHAHIDHIEALTKLKEAYPDAKVAIHELDLPVLKDVILNLSQFMGIPYAYEKDPEIVLKDGQEIDFLDEKIKVIHTPGHSSGSVSFLVNNNLFCGDTIFRQAIGRTDFAGGSYPDIMASIKNKIMSLDDSVRLFPGHMDESTVGYERKNNLFLN